MDKGVTVQNPYGNVTIPRAQLKNSFIRETLGEDLDGVVITNTAAVPTYPTYITQDPVGNNNPTTIQTDYKVHTQESWRRPYNPYAGDNPQNGGQNEAMHNIDLDQQYKDVAAEENPCCCCPCCSCCNPCCGCCNPCCGCCTCCKPCCVVS
ncbi:cysteine-rich tail protein 1 [Hyla sarda]|uniref:cysteine-rich tail protein 1 n=1 Tax=Hyla sarda TaxID=327740 RepID=UPI0024C28069|nr:cysteine-rich tail protein 1 [Hyla sarda]XP_056395150.1 cysteine-rich tail protein 1 [Hyla sarda]XP_056395151.1 cysteine-rich tail protein 1 [Hyla sarda]XP_056395152.1 cysteine-rich tail protein 1 [Hyla sarda]